MDLYFYNPVKAFYYLSSDTTGGNLSYTNMHIILPGNYSSSYLGVASEALAIPPMWKISSTSRGPVYFDR